MGKRSDVVTTLLPTGLHTLYWPDEPEDAVGRSKRKQRKKPRNVRFLRFYLSTDYLQVRKRIK